jgi:hypothetical protein
VVEVADDSGSDLHRAALRVADHEKVVVPNADGESGTAWLRESGESTRSVDTPDALVELVADSR